jgi:hypothetical protein
MSNLELLAQVEQLSRTEKLEMVQFLMSALAKAESLKPLDNITAYRLWSPYDYGDAVQKLMSLLESKEEK